MLRRHVRNALIPFAALIAAACSDGGSGPPVPSTITAASAIASSAVVGSSLSPTVRVTDNRQRPLPGVDVTFEVTAGGGSITNTSATTDANGVAAAGTWTLGTSTGQNRLVARHGSLTPLVFTVDATAGPVESIMAISPENQSGFAGTPVSQIPVVRAVDEFGNGVQGVTVTFAVTAGGGSVTGATQVTNSSGNAAVGSWTLGSTPGANTLTATYTGGNTVTFNATGEPPVGPQLAKFAGDDTTCPIAFDGCVFAVQYTVNGVPTAGQEITWTNGTGATTTSTTDARGIAIAGNLPPNNAPGARTQTATAQTGEQVTFDYTLVSGSAFNIEIRYMGATPTAAVQAAFEDAVQRWEEVITGDLPNIQIAADTVCDNPDWELNETIDDLLVLVLLDSIDGTPAQQNTLGAAGPCFVRGNVSNPGPPPVALMRLDTADLAQLAANGMVRDVILHELGHTFGFPSYWDLGSFDLLHDTTSMGNPYYSGARARPPFVIAGGTLINGIGVPVEDTGGPGTRLGHWREASLSNELMTGFLSGPGNPLSMITIGALMDLGYQVNFGAADAYTVPGGGLSTVRAPVVELIELPPPRPRFVH